MFQAYSRYRNWIVYEIFVVKAIRYQQMYRSWAHPDDPDEKSAGHRLFLDYCGVQPSMNSTTW